MNEVEIKERPILFSSPMIRDILAGRKTQTRRIVKSCTDHGVMPCPYSGTGWAKIGDYDACTCSPVRCPYGHVGDRLWVRETFVCGYEADDSGFLIMTDDDGDDIPESIFYRADHEDFDWYGSDGEKVRVPWKPSIHMPRDASRITLDVLGVRAERLHAITDDDVKAEGSANLLAFSDLWKSINGADSWAKNPWVWVVTFKRATPGIGITSRRAGVVVNRLYDRPSV